MQDYAVRIRVVRPGRDLVREYPIGAGHGTARWAPGERAHEAATLPIPDEVPAGTYSIRLGVWETATGRALEVGDTDLPAGWSVLAGTLTVER